MLVLQRHRFLPAILSGALLAGVFSLPVKAGTEEFFGRWANVDQDTSGIAYITIRPDQQGLHVHVFGQCSPVACDWGRAEAHLYTNSVSGDPYRDACVITANFDAGFAHKQVVLREIRGDRLRYEVFTRFKDSSRRSDYVISGQMARAE
jgi:hypothetical protein